MAFFCVYQQGEFKKNTKTFGGKSMSKPLSKTIEGKKTCFLSFFSFGFFIAFLAVSLHDELKNTMDIFSKNRPENLKNNLKTGR
jgi:hypothetical protein